MYLGKTIACYVGPTREVPVIGKLYLVEVYLVVDAQNRFDRLEAVVYHDAGDSHSVARLEYKSMTRLMAEWASACAMDHAIAILER